MGGNGKEEIIESVTVDNIRSPNSIPHQPDTRRALSKAVTDPRQILNSYAIQKCLRAGSRLFRVEGDYIHVMAKLFQTADQSTDFLRGSPKLQLGIIIGGDVQKTHRSAFQRSVCFR